MTEKPPPGMEALPVEHLPKTAKTLIEVIGLPAALALIQAFGGQEWVFSKGVRNLDAFEAVSEVVGEANALNLARHFAGDSVKIPKCADAVRAVRNSQWRARFDKMTRAGMSGRAAIETLAREPGGICGRKLRTVIDRADDPVRKERDFGQGKLF